MTSYDKMTKTVGTYWMADDPRGDSTTITNAGEELDRYRKQFRQERKADDMVFLGFFHTHPLESPTPSGLIGDHTALRSMNTTTGYHGIGMIIYGINGKGQPKVSFFDGHDRIPDDSSRLNECISFEKIKYIVAPD